VLLGSETPRLFTPPARPLTPATSRGFEAITFAEDVLGLALMPWQKWTLIHLLELSPQGGFRFRTALILCARQQGKTVLLQILALWRLYLDRAGLVIGSAQQLALAEETWAGAVDMAQGVPDLAAEVGSVVRTNGAKSLRLISGERYQVTTASRRGGRGSSSDLVLLDELREHQTWDAWGAVSKTTMARPDPMIVGFSSAGDAQSLVLDSLRGRALASADDPATSLAIFEWSAFDGCDLDDPAGWAQANPALGHTVSEAAIRSALDTDPEDTFRTEVLCQSVLTTGAAFPAGLWGTLADLDAAQPATTEVVSFALDVPADQSSASVAVCWQRPDGAVGVSLAEHRPGVDWVVARLAGLCHRWRARVVVETGGTAGFLIAPAERAGVPVTGVSRQFYVDACGALDAAVTSRQLRHDGPAELAEAVSLARWSTSGEAGTRVLSRRNPRVSPLVAAALAVHGLSTARRRPGRFVSF